jgi:UDP-N-acetylmuramate dehydrogenase
MKIDLRASLRAHNTFGFDVSAQYLAYLQNKSDVVEFISKAQSENEPWQVFGGGSNLVLAKDLSGYTALMQIKGKSLLKETSTHFYVEAMAGESWHEFVEWSLNNGYPGLENLALIPGTVGAAPIQNIGAYGLELEEVFESLEAFDRLTQEFVTLCKSDCQFSYRHSVFKDEPNRYVVVSVCFALPKQWQAKLSYAELAKAFDHQHPLKPIDIFHRVCEIRRGKLPDPQVIGNAGSFFHNPVITNELYQQLKQQFPQLVAYPSGQQWKLAAGWLIDQCGFKGYKMGSVGVYEKQALVLVNHGGGTGEELLQLAEQIKKKVKETFDVSLIVEPVIFN